METEWDKEKQKILNSLLGSNHELEFPAEADVRRFGKVRGGGEEEEEKTRIGGKNAEGLSMAAAQIVTLMLTVRDLQNQIQ